MPSLFGVYMTRETGELIAEDPKSKSMLEMTRKIAKSHATVLIMGETGVGKEMLAKFIHQHSDYQKGNFVAVNCAALPDNMIEAMLFGYERGAFTGAVTSYAGKFEQANNGTLLLDEISEIPLPLQAKLLRVLQEKEVERICGKQPIKVNVRIIAATNRDLKELVKAGLFRKDLYYRLSVVPIYYAALQDRPLDILPLAEYFINKHAIALDITPPKLSEKSKLALVHYPWPGNVRELDNVIYRAMILSSNGNLNIEPYFNDEERHEFVQSIMEKESSDLSNIKKNEVQMIIDTLNKSAGRRSMAAKMLNMSARTLRYKISKMKEMGIKVPE